MTPRFMSPLRAVKRKNFPKIHRRIFSIVYLKPYGYKAKWKVGVASVFLSGIPNSIPHVVTSHTTANNETPHQTLSNRSLLHLYKGSKTNILFQQYAKAWKNTQSKDILSKLKKADLQDASNGFEFMGKVFRWMEQDLNQQLPTHYSYACW